MAKRTNDTADTAEQEATAPAWQAPDYTGPLTADQAEWRHANIKPVRETTKPAGEVVEK